MPVTKIITTSFMFLRKTKSHMTNILTATLLTNQATDNPIMDLETLILVFMNSEVISLFDGNTFRDRPLILSGHKEEMVAMEKVSSI